MDETAYNPTARPNMAPAFRKFLDKALPMDGGSHTLVLGENHRATKHLAWLRTHLPDLQEKYDISSIGVEHSTDFNPLFWAYQDGTLARALGSKAQARQYVQTMMMIILADRETQENAKIKSQLLMAAMDSGIRIVAYDSRNAWAMDSDLQSEVQTYDTTMANQANTTPPEFRQLIRSGQWTLQELLYEHKNIRDPWFLGELTWLRGLNPDYEVKLHAVDELKAIGHKKINAGKLTSDGLSAVILSAMATPTGNRLSIIGADHNNGIGLLSCELIQRIHGTFPDHLSAIGPAQTGSCPHSVTRAVIATTAIAKELGKWNEWYLDSNEANRAATNTKVAHLNLDTEQVGAMWQPEPGHEKLVPLEQKFPTPDVLEGLRDSHHKDRGREWHKTAHLNPLLLPDIKKAAEAVRAVMNPEQQGQMR